MTIRAAQELYEELTEEFPHKTEITEAEISKSLDRSDISVLLSFDFIRRIDGGYAL